MDERIKIWGERKYTASNDFDDFTLTVGLVDWVGWWVDSLGRIDR